MYYSLDWTEEEESDLFSAFVDASSAASFPDMLEQVTDKLTHLGMNYSQADVHDKLIQCGLIEAEGRPSQVIRREEA